MILAGHRHRIIAKSLVEILLLHQHMVVAILAEDGVVLIHHIIRLQLPLHLHRTVVYQHVLHIFELSIQHVTRTDDIISITHHVPFLAIHQIDGLAAFREQIDASATIEIDEADILCGVNVAVFRVDRELPKIHDGMIIAVKPKQIVQGLLSQRKSVGLVILLR